MEYELITGILKKEGLESPELKLLTQTGDYYSTLIFQPHGELDYGDDFIRIKDTTTAKAKFDSFFRLASEKKVALAVTPEYSCPWQSVKTALNNNILPEAGHLWIIGCESIKAQELVDLFNSYRDVKWIYDATKIKDNLNTSRFFDPVCYFFKANDIKGGKSQLVGVIQFKTHPLGGKYMLWEKDNFIAGNTIYVLENKKNSSRLATLICSDTLNLNLDLKDLPHYGNVPYLIVHIQLNQVPTNTKYCEYRANTYNMGWNNIEFLCVNWARNVILDNKKYNDFGGSAIYMQTEEVNTKDARINNNHRKGLHYTYWSSDKKRAAIFFFSYDEYLFLFESSKTSLIHAVPSVRQRTGPEMKHVLNWSPQKSEWVELNRVDDGFLNMCNTLKSHGKFETLIEYHSDKPLDVERLVYLSIGMATDNNWHEPKNITFLHVADDEINKKIGFTDNPCKVSQKEREDRLILYGNLECNIITDPKLIPDSIKDLRDNCKIHYRRPEYEGEYGINIYPLNTTSPPASGAFLGFTSTDFALGVLKKMIDQFGETQFSNRTVIWYMNGTKIETLTDPNKPSISKNAAKSKRSIK